MLGPSSRIWKLLEFELLRKLNSILRMKLYNAVAVESVQAEVDQADPAKRIGTFFRLLLTHEPAIGPLLLRTSVYRS